MLLIILGIAIVFFIFLLRRNIRNAITLRDASTTDAKTLHSKTTVSTSFSHRHVERSETKVLNFNDDECAFVVPSVARSALPYRLVNPVLNVTVYIDTGIYSQ